jgi:LEA14-like dessication related protein
VYRDMRNIKVETIGFNQSTLSFELVYYNPNGFAIDLRKVDSDVYIDSMFLGKFQLDTLMHINRMSEFGLPAKINLDMKALLKNSAYLLLKREVTVQAIGTVRAGRGGIFKTVPFKYEGKHKLSLFEP